MAVKILDVDLTTNYTWGDIKDFNSWSIVKNSNTSWQSIFQATEPSQNIQIVVKVTEETWGSVKELLPTWNYVMNIFNNWASLKNW